MADATYGGAHIVRPLKPLKGDWDPGSNPVGMSCGKAGYIVGVSGSAGQSVDRITGITCKSAVNGALYKPAPQQIGGSTGGNTMDFSCKDGSGIAGFGINASGTALTTLSGSCKPWGSNKVEFNSTDRMGRPVVIFGTTCVDGKEVPPFTYATSVRGYGRSSDGLVAGFGFGCDDVALPFAFGDNIPAQARCCSGTSTGPEGDACKAILALPEHARFSCPSAMSAHCNSNDMKTDPSCVAWCNSNETDPFCVAWNKKSPDSGDGKGKKDNDKGDAYANDDDDDDNNSYNTRTILIIIASVTMGTIVLIIVLVFLFSGDTRPPPYPYGPYGPYGPQPYGMRGFNRGIY